MSKTFLGALGGLAMLAATSGVALAEDAASLTQLTLHAGDTITWTPEAPHRLRFGGSVNNGSLALTKFSDVQKVLENFDPPPPPADANGVVSWPTTPKVTAKVKVDAGTPAVTEFFFTCGFPAHSNQMVTATFKVEPAVSGQPARNIQIVSAHDNAPLRWVIQTSLRRP